MNKDSLVRVGERRIQKLSRVALGKRELETNGLKEGDKIIVYFEKVKL